jgi:sialate O-acetylesterase
MNTHHWIYNGMLGLRGFGPLFLLLILAVPAFAFVRLPAIISDGMVVQRNSSARVWGWAAPSEQVTVSAGWSKHAVKVKAGDDGRWKVELKTGKAGGPYTITVKGENTIRITDVLLGEVWVCSGQSNMEFSISQLGGWDFYTKEREDIQQHDYSKIRLCKIPLNTSEVPLDTCPARWQHATDSTVFDFSATGFFYGRELFRKLRVPIGLVASNWGGTPAEAWVDREELKKDGGLDFYLVSPNSDGWKAAWAANLYNAMIHPIQNFTIRGVIWYQGESNRNDADSYQRLMTCLIRSWRAGWGVGDFPFLFVQIAPFIYDDAVGAAAYIRDAQRRTHAVPNTGMAVTADIGNLADIHPKNKTEVGRRLALWAFAKTYGLKEKEWSGPLFHSLETEGKAIRVKFDHADGLNFHGGSQTGFTVAGKDGLFHPADAKIDGKTILLTTDAVNEPVSVRYAFTDTDSSRLYNAAGLPAAPFRSDDIPFLIRNVTLTTKWDREHQASAISMRCPDSKAVIHYTTDGSSPTLSSPAYHEEISLDHTAQVIARAYRDTVPSQTHAELAFVRHLAVGRSLSVVHQWSPRFIGGENALLDGILASKFPGDGHWQGYEQNDFDGTVDLGDTIRVDSVRVRFLRDFRWWIFLPKDITVSLSSDGVTYKPAGHIVVDEPAASELPAIREFAVKAGSIARFIRIEAKNMGVCPSWHQGAGRPCWLFMDEIVVE